MTAIAGTAVRDTKQFDTDAVPLMYEGLIAPVKGGINCRQGGMAALSPAGANSGYYQPAAAGVAGQKIMGVFQKNFDNTLGANGAVNAEPAGTGAEEAPGYQGARVRSGAFFMLSGTGVDAIAQANVGQTAYVMDDQTVGLTDGGGTRSPAGPILGIDPVTSLPLIGLGPQFLSVFSLGAQTAPKIQIVTGIILVAGVKTVTGAGSGAGSATFSLTASSLVIPIVTTGATAIGAQYIVSSPVTGAPGTAQFVLTSTTIANATATTDVSTLACIIVG